MKSSFVQLVRLKIQFKNVEKNIEMKKDLILKFKELHFLEYFRICLIFLNSNQIKYFISSAGINI